MHDKKSERISRLYTIPMALTAIFFVVIPLIYVVILSFMTRDETFGVKAIFTLENYKRLLDPMYIKIFADSFSLAALTTVLSLLIGYPFGYFMSRSSKRMKLVLTLLVIVPFWTNALIRIYGWNILLAANGPINSALKALGIIKRPLKLLYTQGAVLVGMVYSLIPFMILPIFNTVDKVDWSYVEAARDLGAKPARAFLTIVLPLTVPGILAGCLLVFVPSVGLFFISDLMGGSMNALIGNVIRDQVLKSRDWAFGAALSVALMAATSVVMFVYRKAGGGDLGVY